MGLKKTGSPEGLREVVERAHARTLDGLESQLQSGDAEQRRWAARDLAEHPASATALGEALLHERDSSVRQAVFTSLSRIGTEAAVNALLPLLRSEDAELRNGAIESLTSLPKVVGPRIAALLQDSDPDVRIFTVNLLGELRHEQVRPWLLQVLQHDAAVNVAAAAIEVLAEVGTPADAEALRAVSRRFPADPFIDFAAEMALQRIQVG